MIKTVADLLQQLSLAEAAKLAASDITHAPTIGAMYEGLTQSLLDRAIPPGLDIQVVTGFVLDGLGGRSGQIDCMVVRGEGVPVPHVHGMFEWHVKDVLAVFEVKKTLFGGELADAYDQMRGVTACYSAWIQKAKGQAPDLKPSLRAYAEITGDVAPPASQWSTMPQDRHLILHTVMQDQMAPVRIILGYGGYGTEKGLRTGFIKYLEGNLGVMGFGPSTLPNLIVADGGLLVKLSGHPYRAPLTEKGHWPILGSTHGNPIHFILELLWTRFSYEHAIAELFGDDLEIEAIAPLLDAVPTSMPDKPDAWGWNYHLINLNKAQLKAGPETQPWAPVELNAGQFVVMNALCQADVSRTDPLILSAAADGAVPPEAFVQSLIETRLVALDGDDLTLTTTACGCMLLPDGRRIAADDNTGRLTRWVNKFMQERMAAATTVDETS